MHTQNTHLKYTLLIQKLWLRSLWSGRRVITLQDLTYWLKKPWSQVELSNQISELQYGFKRMRLIGFPGWTLVITSTMSKSLNMSMLQLGLQYLRNALAWETNHCLFIIIILFSEHSDSARQLLCGLLSRASRYWSVNCLFLQNKSLQFFFHPHSWMYLYPRYLCLLEFPTRKQNLNIFQISFHSCIFMTLLFLF